MSSAINYFDHITVTPPTLARQFEQDLPKPREDTGWLAQTQRITLIVLPFLSLHSGISSAISLGMGSCRCVTHIGTTCNHFVNGRPVQVVSGIAQATFAVVCLAGTYYRFTLGTVLTTSVDGTKNLIQVIAHLRAQESAKALEQALQLASSLAYLGIIFTGSLEIILLSYLLQAAVQLYQSRQEWGEGKKLEAVAKAIMGTIRLHQGGETVSKIQLRDLFLAQEEFKRIQKSAQVAKKIETLWNSPLRDLPDAINGKRAILTDSEGKEQDFGSHFHGYGKAPVKGANICLRSKKIDGEEIIELDFKINHVFRTKLQALIQELESIDPKQLGQVLAFCNSHVKNIQIEKVPYSVVNPELDYRTAYKLTFEGMGTMFVGASENIPNLLDRVVLRMDARKTIYDLHEMLAFVNLQDAIQLSSVEDIERLKLGMLFRAFHPREASPMERTEAFFTLPLDALKAAISNQAPEMSEIFATHLPIMEKHEILPGKIRYTIPSLAEAAYQEGARALTASLTGAQSKNELFQRAASIIQMGMLSSESRKNSDIFSHGMSPSVDFETGGADSVFTQLITDQDLEESVPFPWYSSYNGPIRFLFSLDLLQTGTYQHTEDSFGSRVLQVCRRDDPTICSPGAYAKRLNIVDFIQNQKDRPNRGHEVMIKERIPPNMITGIVVPDENWYDDILEYFRKQQLFQKDGQVNETILNIPIEKFFQVSQVISEELFSGF